MPIGPASNGTGLPVPATNRHYTLLTGATGLLGRYLVKDLLLSGVRLAVIARNSKRESAAQRVSDICSYWESELGQDLPRPICLVGDVRFKDLGLSESDKSWVRENCGSCIHNAAILDFRNAPRDQEPWVTNLGGTTHVVDFCHASQISDFHYVSTAYVCGNRTGTILESELNCGQEFRNDYERSKFMAEQLVQDADGFASKTIYRPAVITADSKTGYTTTYHGLHLYLRLMSMLVPQVEPDENGVRHTKVRAPMTGDEQRNVVTVDWVSQVIARLFQDKKAHGSTFHLSPKTKLTPRALIEACYKYFNSTGVEFCGRDTGQETLNDFEKSFMTNIGIYNSYDRCDPAFDTQNLRRHAGDIECPVIDEATIHRFLQFGEFDRWGKRRYKPVCSQFQVTNHLQSLKDYALAYKAGQQNGKPIENFQLGFDIVGLGGGQWHYDSETDRVTRGLPTHRGVSVVRITSDSLQKILAKDECAQTLPSTGLCENLLADYVDAKAYL